MLVGEASSFEIHSSSVSNDEKLSPIESFKLDKYQRYREFWTTSHSTNKQQSATIILVKEKEIQK